MISRVCVEETEMMQEISALIYQDKALIYPPGREIRNHVRSDDVDAGQSQGGLVVQHS